MPHSENRRKEIPHVQNRRRNLLIQYLTECGIILPSTTVIPHASEGDVPGKDVIIVSGVLPLRLAALASTVTEVPLNLPAELRGVELTLEQVRQFAGTEKMYRVQVVSTYIPRGNSN